MSRTRTIWIAARRFNETKTYDRKSSHYKWSAGEPTTHRAHWVTNGHRREQTVLNLQLRETKRRYKEEERDEERILVEVYNPRRCCNTVQMTGRLVQEAVKVLYRMRILLAIWCRAIKKVSRQRRPNMCARVREALKLLWLPNNCFVRTQSCRRYCHLFSLLARYVSAYLFLRLPYLTAYQFFRRWVSRDENILNVVLLHLQF